MGERRLDAALKSFPHSDQVEIIYRCFELDPDAERDVAYNYYDKLAMKYGMSRDEAIAASNNTKRQAEMVGLEFNYDTMLLTNTFDAHRLTMLAAKHGKMLQMNERLFRAYFTESKHIGDHKTLLEMAVEVGLDVAQTQAVLDSDAFAEDVRADEREAMDLGVTGVPFFVINRKYAISGAQPSEVFLGALQRAWQEEPDNKE